MRTKQEIELAFRLDLQALLDKYGAELSTEDHYQGYPECGQDIYMTAEISTIYDKDGNTIREGVDINLGARLCPSNK